MARQNSREIQTQKRRNHIIEAAVTSFIEKGFHQTSIRDIAAIANISVGNLYNHFASKEALIVEIADLEAAELGEVEKLLRADAEPVKILKDFIDTWLNYSSRPENAALTIELMAEAVRNRNIGSRFVTNRQGLLKALSALLRRGVNAGSMNNNIAVEEAARLVLDAIEGLALRSAHSGRPPAALARKELHAMLERYILV